jgi:uncharacterized protein (DUF3820 family)
MNPEHLQRLVGTAMPYGKHQGRLIADLPGSAPEQELDHNGLSSLPAPLRQR